jgi:hypothetical protein
LPAKRVTLQGLIKRFPKPLITDQTGVDILHDPLWYACMRQPDAYRTRYNMALGSTDPYSPLR